jgi:hypothetical protein
LHNDWRFSGMNEFPMSMQVDTSILGSTLFYGESAPELLQQRHTSTFEHRTRGSGGRVE